MSTTVSPHAEKQADEKIETTARLDEQSLRENPGRHMATFFSSLSVLKASATHQHFRVRVLEHFSHLWTFSHF